MDRGYSGVELKALTYPFGLCDESECPEKHRRETAKNLSPSVNPGTGNSSYCPGGAWWHSRPLGICTRELRATGGESSGNFGPQSVSSALDWDKLWHFSSDRAPERGGGGDSQKTDLA